MDLSSVTDQFSPVDIAVRVCLLTEVKRLLEPPHLKGRGLLAKCLRPLINRWHTYLTVGGRVLVTVKTCWLRGTHVDCYSSYRLFRDSIACKDVGME